MELRIKPVTFPEAIEFNFEELKQEITSRTELYKTVVYTEDQTAAAKKDLAQLRKFTKALSDERIKVKKQCLKPYEEFEAKVNELVKIVNEPIALIDRQIKDYDDKRRQDKRAQISDLFDRMGFQAFVTLDKIFDERWLNASVSLNTIEDEMRKQMYRIGTDILTINQLTDCKFETLESYKQSLDLNKAIADGTRMAQIARAKAAYESTPAPASSPKQTDKSPTTNPCDTGQDQKREWIGFKAYLTVDDANALANFFAERHISYRPIKID